MQVLPAKRQEQNCRDKYSTGLRNQNGEHFVHRCESNNFFFKHNSHYIDIYNKKYFNHHISSTSRKQKKNKKKQNKKKLKQSETEVKIRIIIKRHNLCSNW